MTRDDFLRRLNDCHGCSARLDARAPAPPEGPWDSPVILLGRNPGKTENKELRPFVGRSGGYLTRRLAAIAGVDRGKCLVTNLVLCYTMDDRPPAPQEISSCAVTWLIPLLGMVKPKLVVAFGDQTVRAVTGLSLQEARLSLHSHRYGFGVVGCVHPSAAVRGRYLREFEEDMRFIGETVRSLGLTGVLV